MLVCIECERNVTDPEDGMGYYCKWCLSILFGGDDSED
jgi:hypothetical protein